MSNSGKMCHFDVNCWGKMSYGCQEQGKKGIFLSIAGKKCHFGVKCWGKMSFLCQLIFLLFPLPQAAVMENLYHLTNSFGTYLFQYSAIGTTKQSQN